MMKRSFTRPVALVLAPALALLAACGPKRSDKSGNTIVSDAVTVEETNKKGDKVVKVVDVKGSDKEGKLEFNAGENGKRFSQLGPVAHDRRDETTSTGILELGTYKGMTGIDTIGQEDCLVRVQFFWHVGDKTDRNQVTNVTAKSGAIAMKRSDQRFLQPLPDALDISPDVSTYQLKSPAAKKSYTKSIAARATVGPKDNRHVVYTPGGINLELKQDPKLGLLGRFTYTNYKGKADETAWHICDKKVKTAAFAPPADGPAAHTETVVFNDPDFLESWSKMQNDIHGLDAMRDDAFTGNQRRRTVDNDTPEVDVPEVAIDRSPAPPMQHVAGPAYDFEPASLSFLN